VTHQYTPPDESLIDNKTETYDVRREENDASKSAPKTQNQHLDESSITEPITSQTEMSHPPISHLQPIQKEKKRKKRKKIPTYVTSPGVENSILSIIFTSNDIILRPPFKREESTEERLPSRPEVQSQTGSLFEQMQKIALSDNDPSFV